MGNPVALLVFLVLVAGAASFGARFPPGPWYDALVKPPLTPPPWVFGPVWTVLYLAIAVAAWRVWRLRGPDPALALWLAQLVLNAKWSWLFFGLQRPGWALAQIVVLLGLVAATLLAFSRIDAWAGRLFVPYLAWVSFATYLNAGLWWLDRASQAP